MTGPITDKVVVPPKAVGHPEITDAGHHTLNLKLMMEVSLP